MRVEGSHKHQGFVEKLAYLLFVGFNAYHTVIGKRKRCVPKQPDRVQHIPVAKQVSRVLVGRRDGVNLLDDYWLENIQLHVSRGTGNRDRCLVANDLGAHHREGLALRWVHLARHNGGARLILWK